MASGQTRDNVFPTRQTEQIYKSKLKGAQNGTRVASWSNAIHSRLATGYDLLKKKRDALRKEHHAMAAAIFKVSSQ